MEDNKLNINNPQSLTVEMDYEHGTDHDQLKTVEPIHQDNDTDKVDNEYYEDVESATGQEEQSNEQDATENKTYSKKSHSKKWEKERRAREEKYLLSQALAEERRVNLELKNYLSHSIDRNTMSAGEKAAQQLEMAERAHAEALANGDALAVSKTSTALVQANLALDRIVNTRMYAEDKQEYPEINPRAYAANNLVSDWLADNPEFNQDSNYFDENLTSQVGSLVAKLDAKLKREGKAHLISSPEYFNILDDLIIKIKSGSGRRADRPVTAPVNSRNHQQQYIAQPKTVLTEQQRAVAAGCNMTEQEYASWLKKYEKEKIDRENNGNAYGY